MISRSLLIAGTCLLVVVLCAGCLVGPYRGAYRYDDGPYFHAKQYEQHHHGRYEWGGGHRHRHHRRH